MILGKPEHPDMGVFMNEKNEKDFVQGSLELLMSLLTPDSTTLEPVELLESGSWPAAFHLVQEREFKSLVAAVASGRPLLVRGEPGIGKSNLARAAASMLQRKFISFVVQPNTEYQDLLWKLDTVGRLADAQIGELKNVQNYLTAGPLWWAFDMEGEKPKGSFGFDLSLFEPSRTSGNSIQNKSEGVVLLIDEIDKADISLCNGILEVLGNGAFTVDGWQNRVVTNRDKPPLVIMTSNGTRELPAAFLRRCVVLDLHMPDGKEFIDRLVDVGKVHFPGMDNSVMRRAADQILRDREAGDEQIRTGQAEYIDLLRAVSKISDDSDGQIFWLKKLEGCFLKTPG